MAVTRSDMECEI